MFLRRNLVLFLGSADSRVPRDEVKRVLPIRALFPTLLQDVHRPLATTPWEEMICSPPIWRPELSMSQNQTWQSEFELSKTIQDRRAACKHQSLHRPWSVTHTHQGSQGVKMRIANGGCCHPDFALVVSNHCLWMRVHPEKVDSSCQMWPKQHQFLKKIDVELFPCYQHKKHKHAGT